MLTTRVPYNQKQMPYTHIWIDGASAGASKSGRKDLYRRAFQDQGHLSNGRGD